MKREKQTLYWVGSRSHNNTNFFFLMALIVLEMAFASCRGFTKNSKDHFNRDLF